MDMENALKTMQQSMGVNVKEVSALGLAYIGDGVFELLVRSMVMGQGSAPVNTLHKKARSFVNAKAQAAFYHKIADSLTEEEASVFKRGRNAKSFTMPKNADMMDYRKATGVEAIFGYLYLLGNMNRIVELFSLGIEESLDKQ